MDTTHRAISKEYLLGKIDYDKDSSFVLVNSEMTSKPIYLHKECYTAFKSMHTAAKEDGISLTIISGSRNFFDQKRIWETKWKRYSNLSPQERALKILEYSSMPATSRHHWGTDIDINNLNDTYFNSGNGKLEYEWLTQNANSFGFYQVYTSKENGRTGYNEEKWHWSYLPLASKYLEAYNLQITYEELSDFLGADIAKDINVIKLYVNGIAENALKFKH